MEFTLLGAAALAVLGAWLAFRRTPHDVRRDRSDLLLGAALVGLVVGRLASMAIGGTSPLTSPGLIPLIRGGVDTGWASLAALLWLAWRTRRNLAIVNDLATPAVLALSGWEAGCLVRSTCTGTPSDLPWALDGRHPVGLYAAIALAALGWLVWQVPHPYRGGLALAGAAGVRLLTEPLRIGLGAGPTGWYVTGVVVGLAVIAVSGKLLSGDATPGTGSSPGSQQTPGRPPAPPPEPNGPDDRDR